MLNNKANLEALHESLRGQSPAAQLALLRAAEADRETVYWLQDMADDLRFDLAGDKAHAGHSPNRLHGPNGCAVCGPADEYNSRIDLYWHPMAAYSQLPPSIDGLDVVPPSPDLAIKDNG